jgi:hypothetical protein
MSVFWAGWRTAPKAIHPRGHPVLYTALPYIRPSLLGLQGGPYKISIGCFTGSAEATQSYMHPPLIGCMAYKGVAIFKKETTIWSPYKTNLSIGFIKPPGMASLWQSHKSIKKPRLITSLICTPLQPQKDWSYMLCIEDWVVPWLYGLWLWHKPVFYAEHRRLVVGSMPSTHTGVNTI